MNLVTAGDPLLELNNNFGSQFDTIYEFWNSKKFCDLTLIVKNERFEVHKMILASSIPYFKEMFSNDKYEECNKKEIELVDLHPQTMSVILEYIYTRKLKVTLENLVQILHHADYLLMQDIKDWCEEQLINTMAPETCIRNFKLTSRYKLPQLDNKTRIFLKENLSDISRKPIFVELPPEKMRCVWNDTEFETEYAQHAFTALIRWVTHDVEKRRRLLPKLLTKIPIDGISFGFFKSNIENEELLRKNLDCLSWLLELAILLANKAEAARQLNPY